MVPNKLTRRQRTDLHEVPEMAMNPRKFCFEIAKRLSSAATRGVVAVLALSSLSARADDCESLAALAIPYTTITVAASIPAGTFAPPTGAPIPGLPAFCRVAGVIRPTSDSNIGFELWMPSAGWNGKYQQVGNATFGGSFFYTGGGGLPGIADGVKRGYATAGTDDGHASNDLNDATWAVGHPERVIDFGYRAVHETAEKAKMIVDAFYGIHPRHSYFSGCSSGGREALMEAQRFPDDFDGIIAGAPANDFTHLMSGEVWNEQATLANPASYIPFNKLPAITAAALAACDAQDGVVDGIINDQGRCHFDPSSLLCTGAESASCLTAPQLDALGKIYSGARNPRTGEQIFPGYSPGAESFNLGRGSWSLWITGAAPGSAQQFSEANPFFANMMFEDPKWDFRTFNFDTDVTATDAKLAHALNATDPDLSAFDVRGGKIIMYHGWNDPAIASRSSIDYYERVIAAERPGVGLGHGEDRVALRRTQDFIRLFMAPGVNHCTGGPGPNTYDMLKALEIWVENGAAPQRIIASHLTNGVIDRTRPLCPYPQIAKYLGGGSTDEAANFRCISPDDD